MKSHELTVQIEVRRLSQLKDAQLFNAVQLLFSDFSKSFMQLSHVLKQEYC